MSLHVRPVVKAACSELVQLVGSVYFRVLFFCTPGSRAGTNIYADGLCLNAGTFRKTCCLVYNRAR